MSNSRVKKKGPKGKQKPAFAKNKKQAIFAVFILILFLGNSIYSGVKYFTTQNPSLNSTNKISAQPDPKDLLTQQQLESENTASGNTVDESSANSDLISQEANDIYSQTLALQNKSSEQDLQSNKNQEDNIEIMEKKVKRKANGKLVLITVSNSGRSNPFLPAAESYDPSRPSLYSFLSAPPETLPADTDAGKVMSTKISGILYDKYSPSAIINIEGTDYLVKKGDIINNYKILSISKTDVTVQLGANIYNAGVGQLLAQTNINNSNLANLNKKFGGNNISINVRKKL